MSNSVILYSSTGCPRCLQVKEQLKEWGVSYEERNISDNQDYFKQLQERKIFGTPATFINNKPILGFQPEKLRAALGVVDGASAGGAAAQADGAGASSGTAGGTASATVSGAADGGSAGGSVGSAAAEGGATATATSSGPGAESDDIFADMNAALTADVYDLAIIGAGPAGASAALYAARSRLSVIVLDKAPKAGTLAITHKIANYPGVRKEVTGLELLQEMQRQAHDFGALFVRTQVTGVDFSDSEMKQVVTPDGVVRAKSVFIGVGAKAPSSKIKGEEEYTGRGVSYCSTCDAAFFDGKLVAVVGENEEAIHEAGQLAKFCKEVRLLLPTGKLQGAASLSEVEHLPNVVVYPKHRVKEVSGEHAVERVIVQDDQRQELEWNVDGIFLYLQGMKPGTDFLGEAVRRDEDGYVVVDDQMQSSVPGVFAGGDARRTLVKQAVISASDGCIAALGAEKHVKKRAQMRPQYS